MVLAMVVYNQAAVYSCPLDRSTFGPSRGEESETVGFEARSARLLVETDPIDEVGEQPWDSRSVGLL